MLKLRCISQSFVVYRQFLCNYSQKSFIDHTLVPKIIEEELDESYVRGSGPGGQATNKTSNCVVLKHVPTGIIVKCHTSRSLSENRKTARRIMVTRLDNHFNGDQSVDAQRKVIEGRRMQETKRRQNKMDEMKKRWKEKEGLS